MEIDTLLVSYEEVQDAQQFWDELEELVCRDQSTLRLVEQAVRTFLSFAAMFRDDYLLSEEDVTRCCYLLLESPLFLNHKGLVRRRLCSHFVKDSRNSRACYLIAFLLILDGKSYHKTLELLLSEGAFPLLCFLIMQSRSIDARLHSTLLDLLYEMCRIQRLGLRDLAGMDESFVSFLFGLVETSMEDEDDVGPIRAVLVLNEQYMVAAHAEVVEDVAEDGESPEPIPNKVLYLLGTAGFAFKTFGEKIILMINRERDLSLQLLILKLLFLLFTTPETYEYFYYNDLRVLVDVFIRELNDIADDSEPV